MSAAMSPANPFVCRLQPRGNDARWSGWAMQRGAFLVRVFERRLLGRRIELARITCARRSVPNVSRIASELSAGPAGAGFALCIALG
jgi:hypothetical protein